MKIVHIIPSLSGGGKERRLVQLAKGLQQETNVSQHIFIIKPIIDYREIYNYTEITILNNKSKMALLYSLYTAIKKEKPTIVHDWTGVPIILIALSCLKYCFKYKFIEGFIADGNPLTSLQNRIACQIAFKFANAIISNSHAGLIAKHAVLPKARVIYNGFDYKRVQTISPQSITELRQSLNLKDNIYLITMIARLEPAKDWNTFLRVAKQIQTTRNDIYFLAVGKGSCLEKLKHKCSQLKLHNTKFLGFRNDVEQIIAASQLTLLFSNEKLHAEGISNSIMESMAIGVPVIASEGGGTSEIISNDIDGFIIEPNNDLKASQIIIKLLDNANLYHNISQAAKEKIKKKFLLTNMIAQYVQLYKSI